MTRVAKPHFGSRHHRPTPRWHLGDPPRERRRLDWPLIALVVVVFVAGFVWIVPALQQHAGLVYEVLNDAEQSRPRWSSGIHVVDGDTIRTGGETYRLVGFNAPEEGLRANCGRERSLASKATDRLRTLVDQDDVDLVRVPCACPPGTEGTSECNFGRLCGRLKANGRDVGAILIAEGMAEAYACNGTACPKRKDWCAG